MSDRPRHCRIGPILVVLSAVLLGIGGTAATTSAGTTVPTASDASLRGELQQATGGRARIATSAATGEVTFIGGSGSQPLDPPDRRGPSTIARDFVDHYGPLFGVADPSTDLARLDITDTSAGDTAVRFQQTYRGIPVLAGEIAVQVDSDGRVLSTAGEALPGIDIDVTAQVPATSASELARNLAAKYDDVAADILTTSTPELWIYDPSLIGADGPPGPRLVWRVDVRTDLGDVDRLVLIDAHSGTVALQFNQRNDALNRQVCTNDNIRGAPQTCSAPVRVEGAPPFVGAAAADVNSAYDLSGVTYAFYLGLGRDSVDGQGLALKSTVRFCPPIGGGGCPFANAFWNGSQMVYGQGFASADDVVGHELTHGVTDRTSRLFYFAESGAINESMSDVMGELVDLGSTVSGPDLAAQRWLIGEQLPGGALRDMSDPTAFNDPDRMTSPLFFSSNADSRGVHINSGVGNKAAFLITDGGTFNGQNIVGLGPQKAARIYFQADTTMLGPGSDYLDLFHILPQACINLIGSFTITADDCSQVTKAVTATEMDKFATVVGAHLAAPICDTGTVQTSTLFSDNMEVTNGNWAPITPSPAAGWDYFVGSSQSGNRSVHAPDLGSIHDLSLQSNFSIAVPSGTTYLRFDHSFELDYETSPTTTTFFDGGVVEYSADGGTTWLDAVNLPGPTVNGYDGPLDTRFGNPLGGRQAFSGPSPGYESTRINLSSLAGSTIRVRFRLGSDNVLAFNGWFIDDVAFYTCAAPSAPAPPSVPPRFTSLVPGRLLESRGGLATVDGLFNGIGVRPAQSVTAVTVAGRGGVAADAAAVVLNVTVTDPQASGFVTVYPCGSDRPNASSLNYVAGATVANAVVVKVGDGGQVCMFSQAATDLIADVNGYFSP